MKEVFRALNGLRFLAAIWVVFFHYAHFVTGYNKLPLSAKSFVQCGPAGVGFFFILSGFVLAHAHPSLGRSSWTDFWFKRLARIYPVYLFAFLLFLPIAVEKYLLHPAGTIAGVRAFLLGAMLSGTMLQSWTGFSQAWNGPGWSLSVVVFFYLVFPLVLWQLSRMRLRNALCVCAAAWLPMVIVVVARSRGLITAQLWAHLLRNNPFLWSPMFLIGVTTARMVPAWHRVRSTVADLGCVLSAGIIILASVTCPRRYQELLIMGGLAWPLAAIVLACSHRDAVASRVLGCRILNALGKASYATYIIQAPLWHYFVFCSNLFRRVPLNTNISSLQFLSYLVLLICSSFLIHAYIEEPCRRWLVLLWSRRERTLSETGYSLSSA